MFEYSKFYFAYDRKWYIEGHMRMQLCIVLCQFMYKGI
jgi:hypothetical protein